MSSIIRVAMAGLLGVALAPGSPLMAQTNLTATATAPTTVALTWTAGTNSTGYWVQRALGSGPFANVTPAKLPGTAYTDAAAPAGSALRYRIRGTYSSGPAVYSNKATVTTPPAGGGTAATPPTAAPPTAVAVPLEPVAVTLASPPPEQPTAAPDVRSRAGVTGATVLRPLPEQPGTGRLSRVPASTPAPAPAPTVTPVNPSGFIAKQTGDGEVQLSWQPIDGASYYVLLGPGVPEGGTKVSGATTFSATGVPAGLNEWAVASYYEPGPVSTPAAEFPRVKVTLDPIVLSGWADLHTHPMINLAFGGKLVQGGVDVGSLIPSYQWSGFPASCPRARATSIAEALGDDRPSHGGWNLVNFPCGDDLRKVVHEKFQEGNSALVTPFSAGGYPDFLEWPKWNDITHQKMWFEWIRRARDGGLRVMVALATNNKTLGDAVSGPGDGPTDDQTSADLQLTEIKSFVGRHSDFMEVALGPADVKRIVQANKIAVVLGVEIDNIGNFNRDPWRGMVAGPGGVGIILGEIARLHTLGVRYVLPIHVVDNVFGGTAIYKDDFNTSNLREAGHYWELECANSGDAIGHKYADGYDFLRAAAAFIKIGMEPFRRSGPGPTCQWGHRNKRGLTMEGIMAIKNMMQKGMIVDIDHMSEYSANRTLEIAEQFGYPIVSGHSGIRGTPGADAENSRSRTQLERISKLHGMFGLGSDGVSRSAWASQYQTAMTVMGYPNADTSKAVYRNGAISFGTDLNGLVKGPAPANANRVVYNASFPKSGSGSKTWDYNTDGVVHYGMLADFVMDVRTAPASGSVGAQAITGSELVDNQLNRSANYFWQMWQVIETRKASVQ